jgi:ABC-type transport system substrate-binding protein
VRRSVVRRRGAVALLLCAGVLAACSSGGGDAELDRTGGSASSSSGDDRPDGAAAPQRGGILTVALDRPRSLDPAEASPSSQAELVTADLLFDTLTRYDPESGEALPAVALRWRSDDLKTWRFRLRPDAAFGNGRPIGAVDVKYSIERVARKGTGSTASAQLELIAGYEELLRGSAPGLSGVTVPEPDLLVVTLTEPMATFPVLVSSPVFGIVAQEAVEAATPAFAQAPVTSGPFTLAAREGNVLRLRRAPGATTLLDGVDVVFYDDADAAYQAFADGQADWSRVPPSRVDEAAQRFGTDGFRPFHAELFYGFNLENRKFADVRFREAIVRAVDREAIVRAVYTETVGLLDGAVIEGLGGYDGSGCGERCAHDPDAAKRLLAEAFPAGDVPRVGVDYDQGAVQEAIAKAIAADLGEVGIPTVLRGYAFSDYQQHAASGNQQLFRLGWIGAYPSPDVFLNPLFRTDAPDNITGFSDPAVDAELAAARATRDPEERAARYASAESLIMAQVPILPLAQFRAHTVSSSRVHDLVVSVDGTFDATRVWVTPGP